MSLRTLGFSLLFLYFAGGALINPLLGVLGYMAHYIIGPEKQWWHAPLNPLGIRYSLIFAALTAGGIVLNRHKLRFKKMFVRQEVLALLLLLLIWVLTLLNPETVNRYTFTDHPSIKLTKVMIFCLMMTHVVTTPKNLDKVLWLFVLCALLLGLQAYGVPRSAFVGGRLDGRVGGSDFLDSNALAAFMVASTVITGTVLMRSAWGGKILCALSAVFSMNTIVLCRSRGAVLALVGAGIAIILGAPRHFRSRLVVGMIIAMVGMMYVSDDQFLHRIASISKHAGSVVAGSEASDRSTMMRIEAWRGGIQMFKDHPLGVGPGNFNQYIGLYSPDIQGLSPHSTYIQVIAELGLLGLILLLSLFVNGLLTILKVLRTSNELPDADRSILQWSCCGLGAVIVGYATCGLTAHLMYYEAFWWFLLLPACLERASDCAHEDALLLSTVVVARDDELTSKHWQENDGI